MKFAIVSDIHANLPAWKAVRLDIASLGADRIVCLGDVVGYGPNPAETLESVYAEVHHFVLGNHEAVLCGKMDESLFNARARDMIRWTRAQLGAEARRVFGRWPLTLRGAGFRCAHSDFAAPSLFPYLIDPEDATASWRAVAEALLFVGHSHCAGIFLLGASGTPRRVAPQDAVLEEGKRFLVNVGSVGQPRDGDPRASYCLYDTDARALFWRRVPYDVDAYREAVRRAGLPDDLDPVLQHDPRRGIPPLRPMLNFHPPTDVRQGARGCVEVGEIATWRRRARVWRGATLALGGLLVAATATGVVWARRRHAERSELRDGRPPLALVADDYPAERNLAPMPPRAPAHGAAPVGWAVRLDNRKRQRVEWFAGSDGALCARLISEAPDAELHLIAPRVQVEPGQRFTVEAYFRKSAGWRGHVGFQVLLERETSAGREVVRHFVAKTPNLARRDGWYAARETFTIPAGGREIEWRIGGTFEGQVDVAQPTLVRK